MKVKLAIVFEGDSKSSFSLATRGGRYFSWIASLYPWSVLYNAECLARRHQVPFLSLWFDSTWDWTPVSWTTGEHSTKEKYKTKNKEYIILRRILCSTISTPNRRLEHYTTQIEVYYVTMFKLKFLLVRS